MIRMLEMRESIRILEQALKEIPGGPVMDPESEDSRFPSQAGRSVRAD